MNTRVYSASLVVSALLFVVAPSLVFASFEQNLRYGDKGEAVMQLQQFFIAQGLLAAKATTGNFFTLTLAAVRGFQIKHNIVPASGFFGPLTRAKVQGLAITDVEFRRSQENNVASGTRTLFTPILFEDRLELKSGEEAFLGRLRQEPSTGFLTLIRINTESLRGATLDIPLEKGMVMRTYRDKRSQEGPSKITWVGAASNFEGEATFVLNEDRLSGSIRSGRDQYSIRPIGGGIHALIKVDLSKLPRID